MSASTPATGRTSRAMRSPVSARSRRGGPARAPALLHTWGSGDDVTEVTGAADGVVQTTRPATCSRSRRERGRCRHRSRPRRKAPVRDRRRERRTVDGRTVRRSADACESPARRRAGRRRSPRAPAHLHAASMRARCARSRRAWRATGCTSRRSSGPAARAGGRGVARPHVRAR